MSPLARRRALFACKYYCVGGNGFRVLDKRARIFRAWHGKSRKQHMDETTRWASLFMWLSALLAGVALTTAVLAAVDIGVFSPSTTAAVGLSATGRQLSEGPPNSGAVTAAGPSAPGFAILTLASNIVLLTLTLLGVVGVRRLRHDLQHDDDGKETIAQRLLEGYFWGASAMCVTCFAIGVLYLQRRDHEPERIENLASFFPVDFERRSELLSFDATPNTGAVARVSAWAYGFRLACGSLPVVQLALLLPAAYAAMMVVTARGRRPRCDREFRQRAAAQMRAVPFDSTPQRGASVQEVIPGSHRMEPDLVVPLSSDATHERLRTTRERSRTRGGLAIGRWCGPTCPRGLSVRAASTYLPNRRARCAPRRLERRFVASALSIRLGARLGQRRRLRRARFGQRRRLRRAREKRAMAREGRVGPFETGTAWWRHSSPSARRARGTGCPHRCVTRCAFVDGRCRACVCLVLSGE